MLYVVIPMDPAVSEPGEPGYAQIYKDSESATFAAKALADQTTANWYVCSLNPVGLYKGRV